MYIFWLIFFCVAFCSNIVKGQVFNTVRQEKELQRVEVKADKGPTALENISGGTLSKESVEAKKIFSWPLSNMHVTSSFGKRIDPFTGKVSSHKGIDLRARDDSVFSLMPGLIKKVERDKKLGLFIEIDHGIYTTIYGHLSRVSVMENQLVRSGQLIAISGSSGRSTGAHLHLALKKKKRFIDPLPLLISIDEQLSFK